MNTRLLLRESKKVTLEKYQALPPEQRKKISQVDLARYGHLIYELAHGLYGTADNYGYRPTEAQLVSIISSTLPSLKQNQLGFELELLMNAIRRASNLHIKSLQGQIIIPRYYPRNPSREYLIQLSINKAINQINSATPNQEAIILNLAREAEKNVHDMAKLTLRAIEQRLLAVVIAVNAVMQLSAVICKDENAAYCEPGLWYLIGIMMYGDLFTTALCKVLELFKAPQDDPKVTKPYYLSITLISIVGAAIPAYWAEKEEHFGYRASKELSIFCFITLANALVLFSPIGKYFLNKTRFYLDEFKYQKGGPVNPAQIFAAKLLPIVILVVNSLIKKAGYNIEKNNWAFFGVFAGLALTTQLTHAAYNWYSIQRYAERTEKLAGKIKVAPRFSFSFFDGYFLRDKQSENIWSTSSVIFTISTAFLIIAIYPDSFWLPLALLPIVYTIGPHLGTLFMYHVFCRMEVPKSVSKSYIQDLLINSARLGLEPEDIEKLTELEARGSNRPQEIGELITQVEKSAQTGNKQLMFGERNLLSSITHISLFFTMMAYLFGQLLSDTIVDEFDSHNKGSWPYVGYFIAVGLAVNFFIRIFQSTIALFPKLETACIESTGLLTRFARTAKVFITSRLSFSKAFEQLKQNVFVIDYPSHRVKLNQFAKTIKQSDNITIVELSDSDSDDNSNSNSLAFTDLEAQLQNMNQAMVVTSVTRPVVRGFNLNFARNDYIEPTYEVYVPAPAMHPGCL